MTSIFTYSRGPLDFESALDRFFSKNYPIYKELFGNSFFSEGAYPRLDIRDYADRALIIAEIPGLTKDDITIDYKDGILSISGKKREQKEDQKEKYESIVKEIKYSSFCRKITISEEYDPNLIKAKYDGLYLEISIPKKEKTKITKIFVE